ncbi:Flavonol reductase/cinnamoyl-CoA reductase protein [Dioscorea alata]|uniref:Flavonol reductase/cinnamoyl-CoA reductase protein n=1 Tax=Dioscorea alata TaxID=55571 RepID=A0ACB7WI78_DIOAL|nr:Flavonol reductase/cinnamoyl-CoA reductase protein [Dioscorea alata]
MAHLEDQQSEKATVCVMDASGVLGLSLVHHLLQRGYFVHAATIDGNEGDLNGLEEESCSNKRLKIFRADTFDYQSITNAIRGCSCLFYSFEPNLEECSYDELMAEVEVRAAHNVLEACAQTETVERVVFTSSVTAVVWKEDHKSEAQVDERSWSEPNFCRKFKLWHGLAKTLAEKTAWALAMDRGVDMVSINAGLLLAGAQLSPSSPYLKGAPEMYESGVLVTVDLQYLVDAHICVFENLAAFGRYICFNHTITRPEDALKLAQLLDPSSKPCSPSSDELRIVQQKIQNKKLTELMMELA